MLIQPSPQDKARLGAAGAATGLGCSIVVTVIVFIGGGVWVGKATGLELAFTLIGVVLALTAAGYQLYELSRVGRTDVPPGPLTRQIERVVPRRGPKLDPNADRGDEE